MTVERQYNLHIYIYISVLTLILYDIIPSDVRSARGRSHEASCGWDRMRRPRPGGNATSRTRAAPGLRPAANTSCPPGAWPFGGRYRPPAFSPMGEAGAGRTDGSRKARPGAVGKTPAMARHEAPAFSRGSAASNEQWLRHLARHLPRLLREGAVENGGRPTQGPRQTAWAITLGLQRHRCCRLPTLVTALQQFWNI